MAEEERRLAGEIARVLDECRLSHAVHPRKLKELCALRSTSAADAHPGVCFFAAFSRAVTPLFDFPRRTVSSERAVRFVSAFAARRDEKDAAVCDAFLEEFLRFLLVAAAAAHRPARFRACQIISEIIMRLPDDAEVSDELWDEVIDSMKQRVGDKVPAVRAFAVRALSRFVNDGDDSDITNLFLQILCQEQNTVCLSYGPNYCFTSRQLLLFGAMLDYSDVANRKVASEFVNELLLRPLEYEVDDDGNKIVIGDGINLGGDREWARAILELAKKVHASVGEFEAVVTNVIKELAQPCRERTADFMQWMHCLALTGLLLENIPSLWSLQGKAIEPSELLHSLLLPGVSCLG
ncbi:hypothetical protein BHE74_00039816 [Ensete ventricosum]|nr:hypothetical protein BHE74_00039816 [Ensete ventricosum]RZR83148.1 hypothetical protein BHM03_00009704 [Ensete ventricosum]